MPPGAPHDPRLNPAPGWATPEAMELFDDPSADAPSGNAPTLSVSELSGAIRRVVEGEFGRVRVRGEVGRVSRPSSGHLYFDLKDDRAVLAAVCWRDNACRLCEDFPCVHACPTGALRDVATRNDVKMGVAVIDEEACIAYQGMRCEVCYRICPLIDRAITIDYRLREGDAIHSIFAPIINKDECVGCGLCTMRCVVGEPTVAVRIATRKECDRIESGKES